MKKFTITKKLPKAKALIKCEFAEAYPGDPVVITDGIKEWNSVVETRYSGGAVVRVVMENR